MGTHGHLELILKDGTVKKAEVYSDGPDYVVEVLQDLAILAGRENKSIVDLDLQKWFDKVVRKTDSNAVDSYDYENRDYCRIDQREGKIDVDSGFVFKEDDDDYRRRVVDLENPHYSSFSYDPKSLKASLKVLGHRDSVFWKDQEDAPEHYSDDMIDAPIPFKVQEGELLLVKSGEYGAVLFEFDGQNFTERQYNQ